MNKSYAHYLPPDSSSSKMEYPSLGSLNPQTVLLDTLFPGFSLLTAAVYKYTKFDLSIYIPIFLATGILVLASQYVSSWAWENIDAYLMSTADVRIDDEMYNMLMAWIANQKFSKNSRRFVANTNLNSRMWQLWHCFEDESEDEDRMELDTDQNPVATSGEKEKKVQFTPSFGTHYFWYKGRLLLFKRSQDVRQAGFFTASEREEISISSFGRDPTILKDLLDECRATFIKADEKRTIIYRGGLKAGTAEPQWTRCVSRVSRPFSTVVLDETVKKNLLDDMRDYLHPYTRRWYSNRGIPYRRGYLLFGPPGTGKSSLSFAIAGYFKLKIYIVSLNSPAMNEENLGTLFTELPKQCVVLLEDIDTAGLTHTREILAPEGGLNSPGTTAPGTAVVDTTSSSTTPANTTGRISLSALLNILDGVASQEGRVLIMTTNHIDKLDDALIRPGRVDMMVKFDLANTDMIMTIFRAIFATLEGDIPPTTSPSSVHFRNPKGSQVLSAAKGKASEKQKQREEEQQQKEFLEFKTREEEKVEVLVKKIATKIPAMTFSPAEIQGFFLKHKRSPDSAVEAADEWVKSMLSEKRKEKEKEARDKAEAEERERADKLKAEEEKKQVQDGTEKKDEKKSCDSTEKEESKGPMD